MKLRDRYPGKGQGRQTKNVEKSPREPLASAKIKCRKRGIRGDNRKKGR
jgi:hypothetical protein